ncbi:MAG TPA: NTP transferase domain-containing protein [Acidimicrobiales bacterium]|nr:NTP transferase domain-containing protein [Acidimicrobiales bacterium]
MPGVAGMLLTGGSSRRMGFDKASLPLAGSTLGEELAARLAAVVAVALEVGPGRTALPHVLEEPAGSGPLAAIVAGARALRAAGHDGPVLVLACDLPRVPVAFLRFLATWPGQGSAAPLVGGRVQPLCARWSRTALDEAAASLAHGERSLRRFSADARVERLGAPCWGGIAAELDLCDADEPADLRRLGLELPPGA